MAICRIFWQCYTDCGSGFFREYACQRRWWQYSTFFQYSECYCLIVTCVRISTVYAPYWWTWDTHGNTGIQSPGGRYDFLTRRSYRICPWGGFEGETYQKYCSRNRKTSLYPYDFTNTQYDRPGGICCCFGAKDRAFVNIQTISAWKSRKKTDDLSERYYAVSGESSSDSMPIIEVTSTKIPPLKVSFFIFQTRETVLPDAIVPCRSPLRRCMTVKSWPPFLA